MRKDNNLCTCNKYSGKLIAPVISWSVFWRTSTICFLCFHFWRVAMMAREGLFWLYSNSAQPPGMQRTRKTGCSHCVFHVYVCGRSEPGGRHWIHTPGKTVIPCTTPHASYTFVQRHVSHSHTPFLCAHFKITLASCFVSPLLAVCLVRYFGDYWAITKTDTKELKIALDTIKTHRTFDVRVFRQTTSVKPLSVKPLLLISFTFIFMKILDSTLVVLW